MTPVSHGKPCAGNPHARFDEGASAPEEPRRKALLHNSKKVITLLFAVLMGQMVAASDVDLYRGLLFWIKSQNNIEGNELRKTTYPLSQVFDGSFNNQLAGTAIPKRDTQDYTFSLSFKVGERKCVNRLLILGGHAVCP